jgi:hypothetical protein
MDVCVVGRNWKKNQKIQHTFEMGRRVVRREFDGAGAQEAFTHREETAPYHPKPYHNFFQFQFFLFSSKKNNLRAQNY